MKHSLVSIISSLEPIVPIAALIPLLIAFIMWAVFYIKYDQGCLLRIRESFQRLSTEGEKLRDCKKENLSFMDEMIVRLAPPYFLEAWLRMNLQISKSYQGDFIPEAQTFFALEDMVIVPGGRSRLRNLWRSFWVLGVITLVLPAAIAFLIQPYGVTRAFALSVLALVFLCIGYLIFTLMDQRVYESTKSEYHRFIGTFNRILPVTKPEVALLLEATQRNREIYEDSTNKIAGKFDSIVDEVLLPALEDSIATIMHSNLIPAIHNIEKTLDANLSQTLILQESGMETMTAAFAERLGDTVESKMANLASTIELVQQSMKHQGEELERISTGFSDSLTETMGSQVTNLAATVGSIREQMETLFHTQKEQTHHSIELQNQFLDRISTGFSNSLTETMGSQVSNLAATVGGIREQMETLFHTQKEQTLHSIELQNQRVQQLMELQSENMKGYTTSFTSSLSENITGLSQGLATLKDDLGGMNEKLEVHLGGLSGLLSDQRQAMEDSASMLMASTEHQEKTLSETRELQNKNLESSEKWNQHLQGMTETLNNLTAQTSAFSADAFRFTKETSDLQLKMAQEVQVSQGKLEAAVNETMSQYTRMNGMISEMMDNITSKMKEAMAGAGKEIAFGIKEVTADNAEAIANLTEQAQNLRSDYETYFGRMEDTTIKTLEDMDYQVKTIIARITEDIGDMMKNNIQANGDILERYKDNTTDLLESFDEQARSISLYAKEINMDISDLSESLRSSVEEFSQKMQEGVQLTLSEFDGGLSQLTQRIANTVESISDAVEALPEAISRR